MSCPAFEHALCVMSGRQPVWSRLPCCHLSLVDLSACRLAPGLTAAYGNKEMGFPTVSLATLTVATSHSSACLFCPSSLPPFFPSPPPLPHTPSSCPPVGRTGWTACTLLHPWQAAGSRRQQRQAPGGGRGGPRSCLRSGSWGSAPSGPPSTGSRRRSPRCVCVGGGAGGRAGGVAVREQLGLAGWLYSVVMGLHPAAAVASWRAEGKGRGVSAGQSVGRQPQHSVLWLCTCYYACSLSCWLLHPLPPAAITFYTC